MNNKNTGKTEQNFLGFRCEFAAFFLPISNIKTQYAQGRIRRVLEAFETLNPVDMNIQFL